MKVVGKDHFFQEVRPHRQKGAARPSKGLGCYFFLEIKERLKMKVREKEAVEKERFNFYRGNYMRLMVLGSFRRENFYL